MKKQIILAVSLLMILIIAQATTTYAAPTSSPVGVVNYQLLLQQHPDTPQSQATYDAAVKQAQDDFTAKSANMNDQDKKALFQQIQQGLQQQQQQLLKAITDKINAAVKVVADAKGLTIVVGSNATVYGGQDITDDVLKQIKGK